LGPPPPPPRRLGCPFPPVSGGRGTLAGEKGVGRVPIPTRGIHCGTLYMYVLCAAFYLGLAESSLSFHVAYIEIFFNETDLLLPPFILFELLLSYAL